MHRSTRCIELQGLVGAQSPSVTSLCEGTRTGGVTKDEEIDGLGDEAWVLWVGGSGTQVTYHWRRSNLVLEAHVQCFGSCPGNVDAATRAWVDAVDAKARAPR
jgi:hypothetical protein